MTYLAAMAYVTTSQTPTGVQIRAVGEDGREVSIELEAAAGLTLADELTRACEIAWTRP